MQTHKRLALASFAVMSAAATPALAQSPHILAPPDQVIAVKAGHLFDSKLGEMLSNQVVLIKGDKITDVGANLAIPAGAKVIDLSAVTVMPGMIDTHVHVNTGGATAAQRTLTALANAQTDLHAGFTTVMDMDSRGGYNTVDLRDSIKSGFVMGPRMQVVGQSLNQRATNYYPDTQIRFQEGFTEDKNVNSPQLARAAVREAKLHGVDFVKIYTTQDFVGQMHMWKPDATLVNSPSLAPDEVAAITDEAHRLGLKVAEVPIRWADAEGSTVRWWIDPLKMMRDILRIKWLTRHVGKEPEHAPVGISAAPPESSLLIARQVAACAS